MLYLYPFLNAFSWGIKDLVLFSGALLFTAFCLDSYPVKTNKLHGGIQGFAAVEIILCPPTPSTREIMLSVLSYLLLKNCFWIIPHSADVRMCCFERHKNERADANILQTKNIFHISGDTRIEWIWRCRRTLIKCYQFLGGRIIFGQFYYQSSLSTSS